MLRPVRFWMNVQVFWIQISARVGTVVSTALDRVRERAYFALSQHTTNPGTPYPVELPGAAAFILFLLFIFHKFLVLVGAIDHYWSFSRRLVACFIPASPVRVCL